MKSDQYIKLTDAVVDGEGNRLLSADSVLKLSTVRETLRANPGAVATGKIIQAEGLLQAAKILNGV